MLLLALSAMANMSPILITILPPPFCCAVHRKTKHDTAAAVTVHLRIKDFTLITIRFNFSVREKIRIPPVPELHRKGKKLRTQPCGNMFRKLNQSRGSPGMEVVNLVRIADDKESLNKNTHTMHSV